MKITCGKVICKYAKKNLKYHLSYGKNTKPNLIPRRYSFVAILHYLKSLSFSYVPYVCWYPGG